MKYILGVDGGGTKTIIAIANETGKVVGLARTDSADVLNTSSQQVIEHLKNSTNKALSMARINKNDISSACFGMPAVGDVPGNKEKIQKLVRAIIPDSIIVNDVRVALESAHPKTAGMIVLAGTGAMAMAKDNKNNIFRVDGWGEHVGDFGSGYFIGRMILQRAFKEYDGRVEETPILKMVKEFANVSDLRKILVNCKGTNVRAYIANFSKIACKIAQHGIKEGSKIILTAVEELSESIRALINQLDFEPIPLAYAGGLFNCEYFRHKFMNSINHIERIKIIKSKFLPYIGALLISAKKILNSQEFSIFYDGLYKNSKNY